MDTERLHAILVDNMATGYEIAQSRALLNFLNEVEQREDRRLAREVQQNAPPPSRVEPEPYKRVRTTIVSRGTCSRCGEDFSTEWRTYHNLHTGQVVTPVLVRTACTCLASNDPYEPYDKPEKVWGNPGEIDGEWLYPEWRRGRWVFARRER